jgi:hypothetical protein
VAVLGLPTALAMTPEEFQKKWGPEGRGVTQEVGPDDILAVTTEGGDPFSSLFDILNQIAGTWQNIVNAFKTEYKEEIVDKEFENGWSMFKASTRAFKGAGLAFGDEDEFFDDIKGLIQLPDKYSDDFDKQREWIRLFDESTWAEHNTQFDIGKDGSDSAFTMYTKKREGEDKLDVFFLTVNQKFHKADNYFVISQTHSYLGGIFSKTEIKFKKVPAGLSDADITFVSDFFELQAYQQIAMASGGQVPVPPDPSFDSMVIV